ncbi:hypothetical protein SLS54_007036 [Diplodia seriata]
MKLSGDTIRGRVKTSIPLELIESVEASFIGTTKTETFPWKRKPSAFAPKRLSLDMHYQLIDFKESLIARQVKGPVASWPFKFRVPLFTDTVGRHGPRRTSRKFAIQRHWLPPTVFHQSSDGNTARVDYGISVCVTCTDRKVYEQRKVVKIDQWTEQQAVPPARRHDLSRVFDHASTIFIPKTIIPGRQFPITILLTPKKASTPEVELRKLEVIIKEKTKGLFRPPVIWLGCPFSLGKEVVHLETTGPTSLEKAGTASLFRKLLTVETSLQPDVKTFNISRTHSIFVQAYFYDGKRHSTLHVEGPITVMSQRIG